MHEPQKISGISYYPLILLIFLAFLFPFNSKAEDKNAYANMKASLVKNLKKTYIDNAYSQNIDHFYGITCDSLVKKKLKIDNRPIRDILTKLFEVSNNNINNGSITSLGIPSLNSNFLTTLKLYKKGTIVNLYNNINYVQSNIMALVFEGLFVADTIKDVAGLRKMLFEPYYISSQIELPQYAPYLDTLIYALANNAPVILNRKLTDNDTMYSALVSRNNKLTVKAVSQIKSDTYYEKILPFSLAIYQNRITADEIVKLTMVPQDYYHAFVEEVIRLYTNADPETHAFLCKPISDLNKKFGNYYFIKEINELHELPDAARFKVLNTLTAKELYFLMLAGTYDLTQQGSSALYTSSFLYLYKKFLKENEKTGLNKFFDDIDYYQFDDFMSIVSDYGLVADLVKNLDEDKVARYIVNYLEGLPGKQLTDNETIIDAMGMAQILYEVRDRQSLTGYILEQITRIKKQPRLQNDLIYQRIYNVFGDILTDKYKYESDITYDMLDVKRLQRNDLITQVSFFYDDDDAIASYNSSLTTYDAKMWEKKDMGNYIVFNSKAGNKMKVFMNKPNTKQGCDSSQNEMLDAISKEGYEITSYIHRGHSYHLSESLRKMKPSCQFVFLGSCGGYREVLKVFQLNPDANIISTRSVGSKLINDPLLEQINISLVNNKDINWDALWKEQSSKFQSKLTKDLFAAYTAPNKYIGIKFIRKVYNY
jgi:hypothetical protein